jgi:DNA-binding GntR family transcriptional regulator
MLGFFVSTAEKWYSGAEMTEFPGLSDQPSGSASGQSHARPIIRQNLHDVLVSRIRDMIIEGHLSPGTRIHEGNLGQELGVSRSPLREALKYLASEGLLELSPGRGAVVRIFQAKDVHDSLIVLANLESFAGQLACKNASDDQIRHIRSLHDEMLRLYAARDRLAYFKLNQAIHSAILRASGNDALIDVHGVLQARMRRIRYIGNEGPEKWAAAVSDHEAMVAALEKRDGEKLAEVLAMHMHKTWERVQNSI